MFSFLCRKLLRYVWRQTMDVFSPIQVTQSVILLLSKFHIVRTLSLWSWSILLMPCISPLTYVFVLLCVCVCFFVSFLLFWWMFIGGLRWAISTIRAIAWPFFARLIPFQSYVAVNAKSSMFHLCFVSVHFSTSFKIHTVCGSKQIGQSNICWMKVTSFKNT